MRADRDRAAVIDDVFEVVGGEPEIDRHQHRADLRHGVERFEVPVRVGRDVGDAIAAPDAKPLQRARPSVAAGQEAFVGQAQRAIHNRFTLRVQLARPPGEIEGSQRSFHVGSGLLVSLSPRLNVSSGRARRAAICGAAVGRIRTDRARLAALGVYALLAYSVTSRTREIGVRIALGARPADVRRLVFQHGFTLTAIGLGAGLIAAALGARLVGALLYEVPVRDPLTFTAAPLVLAGPPHWLPDPCASSHTRGSCVHFAGE